MFLLHKYPPPIIPFLGAIPFDFGRAVRAQDILPSISTSQPSKPPESEEKTSYFHLVPRILLVLQINSSTSSSLVSNHLQDSWADF